MSIRARRVSECSCTVCKSLCTTPCAPTPRDAQKIIDAGFKVRMMLSIFPDPKMNFAPLPYIGPIKAPNGRCTFQDDHGLCELHEAGLKPLEGKLAHHSLADDGLKRTIVNGWLSEEGIRIFEQYSFSNKEKIVALIREIIITTTGNRGGINPL